MRPDLPQRQEGVKPTLLTYRGYFGLPDQPKFSYLSSVRNKMDD
jgi:hypothetical protein